MLLQACLGLTIDGAHRRLCFRRPELPPTLDEIFISGLRVGEIEVDLRFRRHGRDTGITVQRRTGRVEVRVLK